MVSLFTDQAAKGREHFVQLTSTEVGKAQMQKIAKDLIKSQSVLIQHYFDKILPTFPVVAHDDVKAWLKYKWQAKGQAGFLKRVAKSLEKWMKIGVRPLAEKEQIQEIKLEIARKKQAQSALFADYNQARTTCTQKASDFLEYLQNANDQERGDVSIVEKAALKVVNEQSWDAFLALKLDDLHLSERQKAYVREIIDLKNQNSDEQVIQARMMDILSYEDWPDNQRRWEDQAPDPLMDALENARYGAYEPLLGINIEGLPPDHQNRIREILELKRKVHLWWKLSHEIGELNVKLKNLVEQTPALKILHNNFQSASWRAHSFYECPILNFRRDVLRSKAKEGKEDEGGVLREEMLKTLFAFEPDVEAILKWRNIKINDLLDGNLEGLEDVTAEIDRSQEEREIAADCEKELKAALQQLSEVALKKEIEILKKESNKYIQHFIEAVSDLVQLSADQSYQNETAEISQALNKFKQDQNIKDFYNVCRKKGFEMTYIFPKEVFNEFLNKHKCLGVVEVHTGKIHYYETTPRAIFESIADRLQERDVAIRTKLIQIYEKAIPVQRPEEEGKKD